MALGYLLNIPRVQEPKIQNNPEKEAEEREELAEGEKEAKEISEDPFDCVLDLVYLENSKDGKVSHEELKKKLKTPADILIGFLNSDILRDDDAAFDISQR
mmetsp:Transcript_41804/g.63870  ORF Transcript_41804/g.63870 Transcript_41804/m.63870 type:complete len:101 (+) Transcript_41804:419-721(+)|eukprot:CAMPEP_0170496364 /NCGR_PEP_ID=MMETSP0208-20121228/21191_1 /TAXON_ID=197538 /ORGANISM="Strombidium inclinatum, Strain S3" /LENGTH=100 /DNA_ID=CAMNT_0010772883 /DNA_START=824 /DNA_END=1126 /DNA_ORIENTATION=+